MKSNKNLVLLGMMGSGKSTIGGLLAKKLKLRFYDVDSEIEKKTNMTISEIFQKNGEAYFRNIEESVTLELLNNINCIISLGGGGFINDKIRKESKKKGNTIWLDCNSKILINRIKRNNKRPISQSLNDSELKKLIINRSKIYSKSKYKINCGNMNKKEIVKKIIKLNEIL